MTTDTTRTTAPAAAEPSPPSPRSWRGRGRRIDVWHPEDPVFWKTTGRRVALRNLVFSVFAEHVAFSLWSIWSVVVVSLPAAGFDFGVDQLFWLTALPNLLGSLLRLPYTFAVPYFGGRDWTVISGLLLLIPCALLIHCVTTHAPFEMFLLAAATAGLGGGNFASSMANISYFFPESRKGLALGINAAGGNLGVAVAQLLVPVVISWGTGVHLAYAGMLYLPLVVLSSVCALLFMDNLADVRSDFSAQITAVRRPQTWVISFLYIGTFGSFIGYSFALPLLISARFPEVGGAHFAWLGALVGSLTRPVGGWLADRLGGSRVTLWNFVAMGVAAGLAAVGERVHHFGLFFGAFLLLFVTSGIGNGSVYRMIPAVFAAQAQAGPEGARQARREAAAVMGLAAAVGALGGFFVSRAFATSITQTGTAIGAFVAFLACYALSALVTWWCYRRRRFATHLVPSLAAANV
ncbi:MAG TPA: MFS transporter [Pseudonocardiaceae bacterium]